MRFFLLITYEAVARVIFSLPRYRLFNFFKKNLLMLVGAKIGRNVIFYPGVWVNPGYNLSVGDHVDLALDVIISTKGGVKIGDRVLVGYRTQILSSNHMIPDNKGRIFGAGHSYAPVEIEDDVWIGANCVILPGVKIGRGAVVAASSIVTKDVSSFSVVGGNPARIIRLRS